MGRPRRNHSTKFKSKVALAALKGDQTLAELSQRFDIHPNQITQWKKLLLEHAEDVFGSSAERGREMSSEELKALQPALKPSVEHAFCLPANLVSQSGCW